MDKELQKFQLAPKSSLLLAGSLSLYAIAIIRRAWVAEDAYITFRTIDNFTHGYGLTWNTAERVQAYTHPLWMMLVGCFYPLTRDFFLTPILLGLVCSLAAVILFAWRIARTPRLASLGLLILTFSNAFVDYSTSGLENPLTHLLLVSFCLVWFKLRNSAGKVFLLGLIFSWIGLNRLDTLLLCLPGMLLALFELRTWKGGTWLSLGLLPLFVWQIFSILYYGFPFPNTAYAKLNTGISEDILIRQGLLYLQNSLEWDPLTLAAIAAALAASLVCRNRQNSALALGILFYLSYTVRIGGDFMAGRFLAAPLLMAVILISRLPALAAPEFASSPALTASLTTIAFLGVIGLGLLAPLPAIFLGQPRPPETFIDWRGVADERRFYQETNSLLSLADQSDPPNHPWRWEGVAARAAGEKVVVRDSIGMYGWAAGPTVHIIDSLALSEPLLARLPVTGRWRIGHFPRPIPDGYLETLRSGENQIRDPNLAAYYDKLSQIIRAPLWDRQRLVEIWKMNTGQYDHLLAAYR